MRILILCNTNISAEETAQLLLDNVFSRHGFPDLIISDRGPQFVAEFWNSLCTRIGTKVSLSTAFHPETDGQSENTNAVAEQYLRCFVNYLQDDWKQWLS